MAAVINLRSGVIYFFFYFVASLILWLEREKNNAWYIHLTNRQPSPNLHNLTSADFIINFNRAVKKVLSSRLIMNSRRLWNSHQRHKVLSAEASRDILKLRVSKMVFPGVFKWYFPLQPPCCFVTIHARLGTMASKYPRRSTTSHGSNVSQIWIRLNMHSVPFKTGKRMRYNLFYSMVLIFW